MAKLQYTWATIFLILSASNANISSALDIGVAESYIVAQNNDDEMLDALEERQKKIDSGLEKIRQLTGTESEKETKPEQDLSSEEMIDAIEDRQKKIKELKELKKLEDLTKDRETLETLQEQSFGVESLSELTVIKEIVGNQDLSKQEMLDALQSQDFNVENLEKLKQLKKIVGQNKHSYVAKDTALSSQTAFRLLVVGVPATILVFLIGKPIVQGVISVVTSNYQDKFGKPKVPERSQNLHNDALKEAQNLGRRIEKVASDKFTSDEFKLLLSIKVNVIKGVEGYKELNYKAELLRAAILAQKSFLKLESTELKYRSRKQQQFYQYVADNLAEELDKEDFAKKVKSKQSEILPLINTDEGRQAINSYAQEIDALSKHELGLKLLALFKKFELKDFSIIRDVSNVVEGLAGHDLMEAKSLVIVVKEYYDLFQKISPILNLAQSEQSTATYARILQIVALMHRHGDAYIKFKELVNLLRKWEKSYETIKMIREQYNHKEYAIPSEFSTDIVGQEVYQKYAEYLPDL